MRIVCTVFAFLVGSVAAVAIQDPGWKEARFHRVHLRNGNFLDGDLIKQTSHEIVLKLKQGLMTIRRDMVDRVEFVKLRSLDEKAGEVDLDPAVKTVFKAPKQIEEESRRELGSVPSSKEPAAARTKATEGIPGKVETLIEAMVNDPDGQRPTFRENLMDLGIEAAAYLAKNLDRLPPVVRPDAVDVISRLKPVDALPDLVKLLSSEDASVRSSAVSAIGSVGGPAAARHVAPRLQDPDADVRRAAIHQLEQLEDGNSFDAIGRLCADPDKGVRSQALNSLKTMARKAENEEQFVNVLQSHLRGGRPEVKAEVIAALGGVGDKEIWSDLAPFLRDPEPRVRAAAATALASLQASEAGPDILDRISSEDDRWTRVHLARAASIFKLSEAVGPLVDWTSDEDDKVRRAAVEALETITGQKFGQDAEKWEEWWGRTGGGVSPDDEENADK